MTPAERPVTQTVPPADWRAACEAAAEAGMRFLCLYASREADATPVRALLCGDGTPLLLTSSAKGRTLDTLVDLFPAAAWDEREAHDLFGVAFRGHEPLRALVSHPRELAEWTVPVHGADVHQVAVGPIHAGVIESGHFRFHVVGERILHLDVRLFYKHRGLERAAEGEPLERGLAIAGRACAACAASNSVAYAQACEAALGLAPDRHVRRARTLLLELERLYNHLNDLSAVCAGIGFAPGAMAFAALKERAQRLNARLCGHRFLFGTVRLGRSELTVDEREGRNARAEVRALCAEAAACWREVTFSASVHDRLAGVGVLTPEDARRLGAVGPSARASGVVRDARMDSEPRLWYGDFEPVTPNAITGDVAARAELRALELNQTGDLLEELLAAPIGPGATRPQADERDVGVGRVECPRGETVCLVERAGNAIRRLHLRTASYANWPVLAQTAPGNLVPDFPLINKSFELCYACADR